MRPMKRDLKPRDHSLFLKAFRMYLQYINSGLYFRKEHIVGIENVPINGTPVVVVSNHQNCLNDPLCVCLNLTDRRMNFLARANVFKNPVFNKALRAMGLLPAYRMSHEGFSAITNNQVTLDAAGHALTEGETVMLYPEADHQDKRWLGTFKIGYLRIAFSAAEKMGFKEDVMILPSCNHYSNYFHARTDMLIKFGEPISLKPYYERYQESPRETMVEINNIVRSRIQEMMLHIDDLEHYDEIDFLRETSYGSMYAKRHGFKHRFLPSRLRADQKFVDALKSAYDQHPEEVTSIYNDTAHLAAECKRLGIRDWLFKHNPGIEAPILRGLGLLLLLPLFIVSIIPTGLLFIIPRIFTKILIKDQMFLSSFNVAVSAFISVPICQLIPTILLWIFVGFWWALGYFVAFPFMFILVWNYMRLWQKFKGSCNFVKPKNRATIANLRELRKSIHSRLDAILE
ncbi:MAG: 1-acyl-sn-glycerol-3-phosphate acyltransferase [Alistipes sp.]|nr:1-acyl-sn-glycerol-3-phosphate acyltransferase [Alistipes sp.]